MLLNNQKPLKLNLMKKILTKRLWLRVTSKALNNIDSRPTLERIKRPTNKTYSKH